MIIIGAGMAGLLAANMLRRYGPAVWEAQSELPNNHEALLRFRTKAVEEATGIKLTPVTVHKAIAYDKNIAPPSMALLNMYSLKVTGEVRTRSVWELAPATRYIAPLDFVAQLAKGIDITYSQPFELSTDVGRGFPFISTIPMPALMKQAAWLRTPAFNWKPIWSIVTNVTAPKVQLYQTLYFPSSFEWPYRASFTGCRLIIEGMMDPTTVGVPQIVQHVLNTFGIYTDDFTIPIVKKQEYGKLSPTDDVQRRAFIAAMTDQYNVYSVGRFATWRQILLDDVVKDVHLVEKFILQKDGGRYDRALHDARSSE